MVSEDNAVDLTLARHKVQVTGTYSALGGTAEAFLEVGRQLLA